MTTMMKVNFEKKTIEMSKKFAKAAMKYGTIEYKELQAVRRDYPDFKVEYPTTTKRSKSENKGLTFKYMKEYVEKHGNADQKEEFETLMGEGIDLAKAVDYDIVKEWFLQEFPTIGEFTKKREELLEKIRAQKAKRLENKQTEQTQDGNTDDKEAA